MDCYSSVKISEIKKFAGKWTEVGETISGEAIQTQKEKYSMLSSHQGHKLHGFRCRCTASETRKVKGDRGQGRSQRKRTSREQVI